MDKKQKNEVELRPQETLQPTNRELTNEEKELMRSAIKLVIAKRRKGAIGVTLTTLAKHVELLLPFTVSIKTIIQYIKDEAKDRIITIQDRIGNDTINVEVLLLYTTLEELIEEYRQRKTDSIIKIIDAGLDSIQDYKQ